MAYRSSTAYRNSTLYREEAGASVEPSGSRGAIRRHKPKVRRRRREDELLTEAVQALPAVVEQPQKATPAAIEALIERIAPRFEVPATPTDSPKPAFTAELRAKVEAELVEAIADAHAQAAAEHEREAAIARAQAAAQREWDAALARERERMARIRREDEELLELVFTGLLEEVTA
jgi:hypothetical protein